MKKDTTPTHPLDRMRRRAERVIAANENSIAYFAKDNERLRDLYEARSRPGHEHFGMFDGIDKLIARNDARIAELTLRSAQAAEELDFLAPLTHTTTSKEQS